MTLPPGVSQHPRDLMPMVLHHVVASHAVLAGDPVATLQGPCRVQGLAADRDDVSSGMGAVEITGSIESLLR
jgi:hypothetical protein